MTGLIIVIVLFSLLFCAIIAGIIWGTIKASKDKKSKPQDDKSENQIAKQYSIEKQGQDNNCNSDECMLQNEGNLKIKYYKCDNCSYCGTTNNFFTRWCSYWNKMTFLTDGCSRETTVFDYDYDDDNDYDF